MIKRKTSLSQCHFITLAFVVDYCLMQAMTAQDRIKLLSRISKASHAYKTLLCWRFDGVNKEVSEQASNTYFWSHVDQYAIDPYASTGYGTSDPDKRVLFCSYMMHFKFTTKMFVSPGVVSDMDWFAFTAEETNLSDLYDVFKDREQSPILLMNADCDVLYMVSYEGIIHFYTGNWRDNVSLLDGCLPS